MINLEVIILVIYMYIINKVVIFIIFMNIDVYEYINEFILFILYVSFIYSINFKWKIV